MGTAPSAASSGGERAGEERTGALAGAARLAAEDSGMAELRGAAMGMARMVGRQEEVVWVAAEMGAGVTEQGKRAGVGTAGVGTEEAAMEAGKVAVETAAGCSAEEVMEAGCSAGEATGAEGSAGVARVEVMEAADSVAV